MRGESEVFPYFGISVSLENIPVFRTHLFKRYYAQGFQIDAYVGMQLLRTIIYQ